MSPTASPAQPATLSFEGLSLARGGRVVLRDVSLSIPPGEVTALLGPNGAGKSSLVLAVGGVLRPSAGKVRLGDLDLTKRRPEQIRRISRRCSVSSWESDADPGPVDPTAGAISPVVGPVRPESE